MAAVRIGAAALLAASRSAPTGRRIAGAMRRRKANEGAAQMDGERSFAGAAGGHEAVFGRAHGQGPEPGPSPMELVLMGTGGCSAYNVVHIL